MNWLLFASLLADAIDQPMAVVSAEGKFRLANRALELLLGVPRDVLVDSAVSDLIPHDHRDRFAHLLGDALVGARRRGDVTVMTAAGARLVLTLDLALVSGDGAPGLLVRVEHSKVDAAPPCWPERWMEIRLDHEFGRITAVQASDDSTHLGDYCYRAVAGQPEPCRDCPAPRMRLEENLSDVQVLPDTRVLLRRIHRNSIATAHVSHTILGPGSVARLLGSRLDVLARRATLSDREREVLRELLTGLPLEDIAATLHISTRTVRFHQANVLAKLGIDSRLELIRLLLEDDLAPVDPAR